jgi:hypothetical protein
MENIKIPDDFYIYTGVYGYKWLCHKSCVCINNNLSNIKYLFFPFGSFSDKDIAKLRYKCNIIDEIEEKTYFIDCRFNNIYYNLYDDTNIYLHGHIYKCFHNVNDFIDYLAENYPESVKGIDIKIALKD